MILVLISASVAFACGVWLLVSALFPAPPPLADAIERLHQTRSIRTMMPTTAPSESILVRVGRSLLDRSSSKLLSGEQLLMDLEVVRRPVEVHAGNGPAFMELRRATTKATYSGAIWDALEELGQRVGIVEIREIAAAGMLSGERGAAVRRSLVAKARSLRTSTLSASEVTARKQSQAMFAPIVLIGFAFITFLMYPLVTNLSVG